MPRGWKELWAQEAAQGGEWQGQGAQTPLCPCFDSQTCSIWLCAVFRHYRSNAAQIRSLVLGESSERTTRMEKFGLLSTCVCGAAFHGIPWEYPGGDCRGRDPQGSL